MYVINSHCESYNHLKNIERHFKLYIHTILYEIYISMHIFTEIMQSLG